MHRQLKLFIGGMICAVLPYVLSFAFVHQVVENGVLVRYDRVNFTGFIGGIIALAIAWRMLLLWETEADKAPKWRAAGALVAVAGVAQLLVSLF